MSIRKDSEFGDLSEKSDDSEDGGLTVFAGND